MDGRACMPVRYWMCISLKSHFDDYVLFTHLGAIPRRLFFLPIVAQIPVNNQFQLKKMARKAINQNQNRTKCSPQSYLCSRIFCCGLYNDSKSPRKYLSRSACSWRVSCWIWSIGACLDISSSGSAHEGISCLIGLLGLLGHLLWVPFCVH